MHAIIHLFKHVPQDSGKEGERGILDARISVYDDDGKLVFQRKLEKISEIVVEGEISVKYSPSLAEAVVLVASGDKGDVRRTKNIVKVS